MFEKASTAQETLCMMLSLELNRFRELGDAWTSCIPGEPDLIAVKLETLGESWIPVKGNAFYNWILNPQRTPAEIIRALMTKQQSNKKHD